MFSTKGQTKANVVRNIVISLLADARWLVGIQACARLPR